MHSQADQLNCKNQVDAAFFKRGRESQTTDIETLKNSENQIFNISADKVNVAKQSYEKLYGSSSTDQILQHKFLHHLTTVISSEDNEFLFTAILKTEIYNAICK